MGRCGVYKKVNRWIQCHNIPLTEPQCLGKFCSLSLKCMINNFFRFLLTVYKEIVIFCMCVLSALDVAM